MYTTLIAALSGDQFLPEALESVYNQTVKPTEVVVLVDEDSPEDTDWRALINARFPSVIFQRQTGTGMISALNFGIEKTVTPYIAFLDCDDLWQESKQELQLSLLQEDSSIDAVTCKAENFYSLPSGKVETATPVYSCTFTCTTFRKDTFERFGLIDATSTHHTWLYRWWSHARASGIRSSALDYVGMKRRVHAANSWVTENRRAHSELLTEIRRITTVAKG